VNSTRDRITVLQRYGWETSLLALIGAVIATLALTTHLFGRATAVNQGTADVSEISKPNSWHALSDGIAAHSNRVTPRPRRSSNPDEVVVCPSPISGRFILLASDRRRTTPKLDELTLRVRVISLAAANLVTPFQSGMLEVRTQGQEPVQPQRAFSLPVPAGNSRDETISFLIPANLSLEHSNLRIAYFNEAKEIPLTPPPHDRSNE
jgi:hypothetical protein